jgi:hypothetical protein
MKIHPSALFNREMVDHSLPSNPREIDAVVFATRRCYDLHPYFSMRYGARGSTFARSDGGYLVTLVDQPQDDVDTQVFWLAGMLANKGMPRWLMEAHLNFLYEELSTAVPEREAAYRTLRHTADRLRAARQAWIPQQPFDALIESFDATSGGWINGAGGLIGAAVCDECNGLDLAVPSLLSWMGDTTRFSLQWCAAVAETLRHAHSLAAQAQQGHCQ